MDVLKTIFLIVHLLACVTLIAIVVLQSGKSSGLSGAIGGGSAETYLSKNKTKSRDARLTLATKWVAGVFVILTIALNLI